MKECENAKSVKISFCLKECYIVPADCTNCCRPRPFSLCATILASSNAAIAFVNYFSIVKVDGVIKSPGQLPFLDILISRDNERLNIDFYRKPTHTDRYILISVHIMTDSNKISTAATLLHRALKLPNSEAGKAREIDHISTALQSNGYPQRVTADIIRKKSSTAPTPSREELVGMFFSWSDPMKSQELRSPSLHQRYYRASH